MFLIIVTTVNGKFYYSPTLGLVKEKWRAMKTDKEGAELAVRVLSRETPRYRRDGWQFVEYKPTETQPAELPTDL